MRETATFSLTGSQYVELPCGIYVPRANTAITFNCNLISSWATYKIILKCHVSR